MDSELEELNENHELERCPLCNGNATFGESDVITYAYQIECDDCYVILPGDDPEEMAVDWNRRDFQRDH